MASGVWAGAEGRQGGALSRGGGRGRGESPSWAVWRPFTHIPEGRGQGGGPGASGQWTGIQAQGCHTVEIGDAGPGAPEVPLTLLFLSSLLSGSIPVCLSLCTFVFLWGCLSLHLPLSSLLPLPSLPLLIRPVGSGPSGGARLPGWTVALSREVIGLSPGFQNSHDQLPTQCQVLRDRDASSSWVLFWGWGGLGALDSELLPHNQG